MLSSASCFPTPCSLPWIALTVALFDIKAEWKKIALISPLTAAEWAPPSRGCLKWSVAVMQGSLVLLNERGCCWWLTFAYQPLSVLKWQKKSSESAPLLPFVPLFPTHTKSVKACEVVFFLPHSVLPDVTIFQLQSVWKCHSGNTQTASSGVIGKYKWTVSVPECRSPFSVCLLSWRLSWTCSVSGLACQRGLFQ